MKKARPKAVFFKTQHNLTTSRPEDRNTIQPQTNLKQPPSLPYRTYIEETHIYNVLCLYDILPVRDEVDQSEFDDRK